MSLMSLRSAQMPEQVEARKPELGDGEVNGTVRQQYREEAFQTTSPNITLIWNKPEKTDKLQALFLRIINTRN